MCPLPQPEEFWEIQVHGVGSENGLSGLCVGFENGKWRYKAFADYIMEWLPEFCLNSKERNSLSHQSAVKSLRKAAKLVYQTDKYSKRGEFGEIFLHAAIRCVFDSLPAISKLYYKSSANNTVKGFDCVHVVGEIDELEIWLGEVKFYSDGYRGIREVVEEIKDHLDPKFLRNEFILIGNKLSDRDSYTVGVQKLISERTSLDKIFKRVCIPVFITYESNAVEQNVSVCDSYIKAFHQEVFERFQSFSEKVSGFPPVRFHLFLMPIEEKTSLIDGLNEKLKAWQQI